MKSKLQKDKYKNKRKKQKGRIPNKSKKKTNIKGK